MGSRIEKRIQKWINEQEPGYRFTVKEITRRLNIDSATLGNWFRRLNGVQKGDMLAGGVQEWVIIKGAWGGMTEPCCYGEWSDNCGTCLSYPYDFYCPYRRECMDQTFTDMIIGEYPNGDIFGGFWLCRNVRWWYQRSIPSRAIPRDISDVRNIRTGIW